MTSKNIKLAADEKRSAAKQKLSFLFKIPDGYQSNTVNELIDDIITSVILEMAAMQAELIETK